jgi:osmotically-inducible protein OsmY
VTLAGHLNTFGEKWAAERAAQRVTGVKALAIEIEVTLAGCDSRTDADIARAIEDGLRWVTYVPKDAIKVLVEKGWVTLSGTVEWDYQRQNVEGAVRYLTGVKGISDNIVLSPPGSSRAIKADIEAFLGRRDDADLSDITVSVHDADVTLTGTIHGWWQRELARQSAWSASGVKHVVDNLTIRF